MRLFRTESLVNQLKIIYNDCYIGAIVGFFRLQEIHVMDTEEL